MSKFKEIKCNKCEVNINKKDAVECEFCNEKIINNSESNRKKSKKVKSNLYCSKCIINCYNCKESGCKKCIGCVCCDCGVRMCPNCSGSGEPNCGCYGRCSSCRTDVNRGQHGWPCTSCRCWYCDGCRNIDNYCLECGQE